MTKQMECFLDFVLFGFLMRMCRVANDAATIWQMTIKVSFSNLGHLQGKALVRAQRRGET